MLVDFVNVLVFQVIKAQTQVVAGTKYTFEILFGESECKKGVSYLLLVVEKNCIHDYI